MAQAATQAEFTASRHHLSRARAATPWVHSDVLALIARCGLE